MAVDPEIAQQFFTKLYELNAAKIMQLALLSPVEASPKPGEERKLTDQAGVTQPAESGP